MDDKFSGIKIGDKTYNVVVSLNGCYWYIDEDGKKKPIADLPKGSYEWVNIAEKVLKELRTCYRTLGGKVEVWSWYLVNDEMETLKEQHKITDSTDVDNPIGTLLTEIPADWVMIDCDLPDMTERDVTMINRCYRTPGGKVEIEGLEAIDDKLQIRESIYVIIQSTDDDFPAGYEFNLIPANWERMVCDFPDMTERDVTYANECYQTENGKVNVEGLRAYDNILGVRESWFTVLQSTDPEIPVGTYYPDIPDDWIRIVCDFPDMTQRDIVIWNFCYNTGNGKVEVKGYQSVDPKLGVREQYYFIVNSTDPDNPQWKRLDSIPNTWGMTECDFPDMTERHIVKINECYSTEGGKVRLTGFRSFDGEIGVRAEYLIVAETTDPDIAKGTTYTKIPVGWVQIVCDFADQTTADTEITENCFSTGDGKVQLRTYLTLDGYGKVREARHLVLRSTDPAYVTGDDVADIPAGWKSIECDFASLTQRHALSMEGCYTTKGGKVHIRGIKMIDNLLNEDSVRIYVLESTDEAYAEGTKLNMMPADWRETVCDFPDWSVADTEVLEDCFKTDDGDFTVRSVVVHDAKGKPRYTNMRVTASMNPNFPIGMEVTEISEEWERIECSQFKTLNYLSECYEGGDGKIYVEGYRVVSSTGRIYKEEMNVKESTSASVPVGTALAKIPDGFTKTDCLCTATRCEVCNS